MANYSGITDLDYYKIWIISDNAINEVFKQFILIIKYHNVK